MEKLENIFNELTVSDFLKIREEINNKYLEMGKLSNVLRGVRNKRLVNELDYTDDIQEYIEIFQTTCALSNYKYDFYFRSSTYAKTGTRWYCEFYRRGNNIISSERKLVDIIHIPRNSRIGKRIEIIIKISSFNYLSRLNPFFGEYEVKKLSSFPGLISIRFEEPEDVLKILSFLNSKIDY